MHYNAILCDYNKTHQTNGCNYVSREQQSNRILVSDVFELDYQIRTTTSAPSYTVELDTLT